MNKYQADLIAIVAKRLLPPCGGDVLLIWLTRKKGRKEKGKERRKEGGGKKSSPRGFAGWGEYIGTVGPWSRNIYIIYYEEIDN